MDIAPLSGNEILLGGADFTFFGGLYRGVDLITTSTAHVDVLDFASSGVYVKQQNVTDAHADLQVTTRVRNDAAIPRMLAVTVDLVDAGGVRVGTVTASQLVPAGTTIDVTQPVGVDNPHLWNGTADPYLYNVYVTVPENGTVVDTGTTRRACAISASTPTTASSSTAITSTCTAWTTTRTGSTRDGRWTRPTRSRTSRSCGEMGVNFVRMSHYQHHPETYDLFDKTGIITWSEIPLIYDTTDTPEFKANIEQQLREMIRQNYNHPSVVFWGLYNGLELDTGDEQLVPHLNDVAHQEDPSRRRPRPPSRATRRIADQLLHRRHRLQRLLRLVSRRASATSADYADRSTSSSPPAVRRSASSAPAAARQHGEKFTSIEATDGNFHPEQYQALFHEQQWAPDEGPGLPLGQDDLSMFDFAVDDRTRATPPAATTRAWSPTTGDRKDAFYFYKANWTSTPTLHLNDARYTQRPTRLVTVKAYSNLDSVQLFVNDQLVASGQRQRHRRLHVGGRRARPGRQHRQGPRHQGGRRVQRLGRLDRAGGGRPAGWRAGRHVLQQQTPVRLGPDPLRLEPHL